MAISVTNEATTRTPPPVCRTGTRQLQSGSANITLAEVCSLTFGEAEKKIVAVVINSLNECNGIKISIYLAK